MNFFKDLQHIFDRMTSWERWGHGILWLGGLIFINIPSREVTIGVFYSHDYSLLIPSIYGTFLNMLLVYGTASIVSQNFGRSGWPLFLKVSFLLIAITVIEGLLDLVVVLATSSIDDEMLFDLSVGNLIMNGIFFFIPALVFGIIKGWSKVETMAEKVLIKDGHSEILLDPSDIFYLESDGNYVRFHTNKGVILERTSMSALEERMPKLFVRCHKSFMVNRAHISKLSSGSLEIQGAQVPIGRKYRRNLEVV